MKNLNIVGYIGHNNEGDDQYHISFNVLFGRYYNLNFIDCDKLKDTQIPEDEIIIFGGGDILNLYFLDELNKYFKNKKIKFLLLVLEYHIWIYYFNIIIKFKFLIKFL